MSCLKIYNLLTFLLYIALYSRSQWPRGLRRWSTAARLLGLWVRIPSGEWMFVCVECCVLSGRGLCDALITRLEESYRLWRVVVCDLETSRMRGPWPALGRSATKKKHYITSEKIFGFSILYSGKTSTKAMATWPLGNAAKTAADGRGCRRKYSALKLGPFS